MELADWAEDTARTILQVPLPRRWAHTQGVAAQARTLEPILGKDTDLLVAAAWLHDIGYAPDLVDTGFHPLDGARYLGDTPQADDLLCRLGGASLVRCHRGGPAWSRWHSASRVRPVGGELADALIYCDMTTGPDGQRMSVEQRLAEIRSRYGPDDPVSRALAARRHRSLTRVYARAARLANATSAGRLSRPAPGAGVAT